MADAYLQSLLADGEGIRSEARQHPMALIRFAIQPILVFLAALVCLAIGTWLTPDGQGLFNDIIRWIDTLLGLLTAGLFLLALVWFPIQVFRWTKRRYMVTDRRVLYVDGVLRKNSVDAGLSMITDVGFRQGLVGRSLGYGDLVVATASNRPLHFREIRDALGFKQAIMAAQHATIEARADEILVSRGLAPAASGRPVAAATTAVAAASAPAATVPTAESAAAAQGAGAEPAQVPAWDGSDVPQMHEDDAPPSDPMIFGTPGSPREEEAATSTAVADAPAVVGQGTGVPQMMEDDAPDLDPLVTGGPVGGAEQMVEDVAATEEAADLVAGTTDETSAEVPAEAEAASADVAEAIEDAAESVEPVAETGGPASEEPAAPATPAQGHVAAIQEVDATIGGLTEKASGSGADAVTSAIASLAELRDTGVITAEEYEERKQALLDRL